LETGSTLLYPLFNLWAAEYTDTQITTQSTGSGTSISEAISGIAQIGRLGRLFEQRSDEIQSGHAEYPTGDSLAGQSIPRGETPRIT
jgi:ABC-type phosphate transport system substrate-binding protein